MTAPDPAMSAAPEIADQARRRFEKFCALPTVQRLPAETPLSSIHAQLPIDLTVGDARAVCAALAAAPPAQAEALSAQSEGEWQVKALEGVLSSGESSYRNGGRFDDVIIARSAYDDVRSALTRSAAHGDGGA